MTGLYPLSISVHLTLRTWGYKIADLKVETSISAIAETALQGGAVLAKSGRRYSADNTGLLRRSRSFKVTDVGTNR